MGNRNEKRSKPNGRNEGSVRAGNVDSLLEHRALESDLVPFHYCGLDCRVIPDALCLFRRMIMAFADAGSKAIPGRSRLIYYFPQSLSANGLFCPCLLALHRLVS